MNIDEALKSADRGILDSEITLAKEVRRLQEREKVLSDALRRIAFRCPATMDDVDRRGFEDIGQTAVGASVLARAVLSLSSSESPTEPLPRKEHKGCTGPTCTGDGNPKGCTAHHCYSSQMPAFAERETLLDVITEAHRSLKPWLADEGIVRIIRLIEAKIALAAFDQRREGVGR